MYLCLSDQCVMRRASQYYVNNRTSLFNDEMIILWESLFLSIARWQHFELKSVLHIVPISLIQILCTVKAIDTFGNNNLIIIGSLRINVCNVQIFSFGLLNIEQFSSDRTTNWCAMYSMFGVQCIVHVVYELRCLAISHKIVIRFEVIET